MGREMGKEIFLCSLSLSIKHEHHKKTWMSSERVKGGSRALKTVGNNKNANGNVILSQTITPKNSLRWELLAFLFGKNADEMNVYRLEMNLI